MEEDMSVPCPSNIFNPYKSPAALDISPSLIISAEPVSKICIRWVVESISIKLVSNLKVSVLISTPLVESNLT